MAEQLAEVGAIADNPAPPTFENTIVALEKSGSILNRAQSVFYNLVGADTNPARERIRAEYAPKFSAHGDAIGLDPKLFARIKALHDGLATSTLDAEGKRLVTKYYEDFVRAGANLSDADKATLRGMNGELAKLGTQFSQNVLAEVNASAVVVDTREELAGLPEGDIAGAAEAAKARGLEGKYVLALQNTTGEFENIAQRRAERHLVNAGAHEIARNTK